MGQNRLSDRHGASSAQPLISELVQLIRTRGRTCHYYLRVPRRRVERSIDPAFAGFGSTHLLYAAPHSSRLNHSITVPRDATGGGIQWS